MDKKKKRKGTPYSPELAKKICGMIEDGKSLTEICLLDFMPNRTTILRWSVDDRKPEFGVMYAKAYRVRILSQIEERDELALVEIEPITIAQCMDKYDVSVQDDKMIALYIRTDLQARQSDRKIRIDHLGKSIGQLLQVFDSRFSSGKSAPPAAGAPTFDIHDYGDEK